MLRERERESDILDVLFSVLNRECSARRGSRIGRPGFKREDGGLWVWEGKVDANDTMNDINCYSYCCLLSWLLSAGVPQGNEGREPRKTLVSSKGAAPDRTGPIGCVYICRRSY